MSASSDVITPTRIRQLKQQHDICLPICFSPQATSSPVSRRSSRRDISNSSIQSSQSDSSGDITLNATQGVDESVILDVSKSSIEKIGNTFLDKSIDEFDRFICTVAGDPSSRIATREHMLLHFRKKKDGAESKFWAIVVTERILWEACRTWQGTLRASDIRRSSRLREFVSDGFSSNYLENTSLYLFEELGKISPEAHFNRRSLEFYFGNKGVTNAVLERIFEKNLVRTADKDDDGDSLWTVNVIHLIFALHGMDDCQSIEYWFRVLDVESNGKLEFSTLRYFYEDVCEVLAEYKVDSLMFEDVICQYIDMLSSSDWTLGLFKSNRAMASQILIGFVNAVAFFDHQADERSNVIREADTHWGAPRSAWERMLDEKYELVDEYSTTDYEVITLD